MRNKSVVITTAFFLFLAVTVVNAAEKESPQLDPWQFFAQINGFLPDIKGETARGNDL